METNNKLRETLMSVKKSIDGMGAASLDGDPEIMLMSLTQVCARLSSRIEAALAEPVKNYEVGTVADQLERFEKWFPTSPYNDGQVHRVLVGYANWAQMPYGESKAKGD